MGLVVVAQGQMARSSSSEERDPWSTPQPSCTCLPASVAFTVNFLNHSLPLRCSSAVRNGLLLLNLLLCNHHTLGDQIITQELRDTLFRHSGIAPGTEPMPTTRTILMMLLNRYSEPRGSPERAGTIVGGCPADE